MKARVITGLILAGLVIWAVELAPFPVVALIAGIALLGAQAEFYSMHSAIRRIDRVFGGLCGIVLLLLFAFSSLENMKDMLVFALPVLVIACLLEVLFFVRPIENAGSRAMTIVTGLVYVVFLGGFAILLARDEHGSMGRNALLTAAGVTWLGDTMAFFVGKTLGRHRLYPVVSPKKTWEGAFGGLLGSVGGAMAVRALFWHDAPLVQVLSFSIVGSIVGQMGDLVESFFKRSVGIKDSGAILPGHGGVLDRIDAFLFVVPLCYLWFF